MAEENTALAEAEEALVSAKDDFSADNSVDNKDAVREAKGEVRYQRWLARGGPAESTVEKIFKERGVVQGRFLEQWLLDRWLDEVDDAESQYDEWVDAAHQQATLMQKGN